MLCFFHKNEMILGLKMEIMVRHWNSYPPPTDILHYHGEMTGPCLYNKILNLYTPKREIFEEGV